MGIVITGGIGGFLAAVTGLLLLDWGWLLALLVWGGSGPAAALVSVALTWNRPEARDPAEARSVLRPTGA